MAINPINKILINQNSLKKDRPQSKERVTQNKSDEFDKIDLSTKGGQLNAASIAQKAITDLKSLLVENLSNFQNGGEFQDLQALITPKIEEFNINNFSNLSPEAKNKFFETFTILSQQSGGLVTENLINQTFGSTGEFDQLISQISDILG